MICNKNQTRAITRCDVMALITAILILCIVVDIMRTALIRCPPTSRRAEIKMLIMTIDQALAMYKMDLGAFPPDRKNVAHVPKTVNECTPNNPAPQEGIFDTSLSKYYDDNLVRHIDGDTSNDKDIPGYDDVSTRPLDNYLDTKREDLRNKAGGPVLDGEVPIITTYFGSTIKYNELASERRTKKLQVNDPDPRNSIVKFDSFQLYSEADDLEKRYPSYFITNFTD